MEEKEWKEDEEEEKMFFLFMSFHLFCSNLNTQPNTTLKAHHFQSHVTLI